MTKNPQVIAMEMTIDNATSSRINPAQTNDKNAIITPTLIRSKIFVINEFLPPKKYLFHESFGHRNSY